MEQLIADRKPYGMIHNIAPLLFGLKQQVSAEISPNFDIWYKPRHSVRHILHEFVSVLSPPINRIKTMVDLLPA